MRPLRFIAAVILLALISCAPLPQSPLPTAVIVAQPTPIPTQIKPTMTTTATPTPTTVPTAVPTATPIPLPGYELFTFAPNEPSWFTVDDDVMGGVSSSTTAIIEPNILVFTGTMSLENNGGFSSVRSEWSLMNLSDADGVLLRVLGDGKTYRLRIRTESVGRGISYNAIFQTQPNQWQTLYVPFADMVPTYRGFLMDVGPLDTSTIGSFGFMLSDKQAGAFSFQVDWIRAVRQADLPNDPS